MARILVIEDEELGRMLLRNMLESGGHDVEEAENGELGLAHLETESRDLVVTDLVMPKKEGIETISELRRRYPEIKIIAISGGDTPSGHGILKEAKARGAHGVLAKPFRKNMLLDMVDQILE